MLFLNSPILIGLVAIVIPVALHFLLKQKPKKLLFPALRLIQQRQKQSMRRMRLKHFWLMLLRVLILAAIVLAIARPSLPPANYNLSRMELGVLLTAIISGAATYVFFVRRLQKTSPPKHLFQEKQSTLRNYSTFGTVLAILACVGCPYQQRIAGELKDPRPIQDLDLPVAGILLFDTSLSMSYLKEGKTALDQAREIALEHLQTLPPGSRIAITDNSSDNPILFQSTMLSAQTRLDSLEIREVTLPLDERLQLGLKAHQEDRARTLSDQSNVQTDARKDRYLRRIYVLTDMAKTAWKNRGSDLLQIAIKETAGASLYLVDVGQESPQNVSISQVQLSRETVPIGGDLIVSATISVAGNQSIQESVEMRLRNTQNTASKVGQLTVQLDPEIPVQIAFPPLSDLKNKSLHGEVRLATNDPLAFDNVRYFSAEVIPAPKVLVVGPDRDDVNEWMIALSPLEDLDSGQNKFIPEYIPLAKLKEQTLTDFTAVTLINCPGTAMNDDQWFQLGKYVENGGGLIIVLGADNLQLAPLEYNRARAQVFLPARLDYWKPKNQNNDWRFSLDKRTHPLFWKFRQLENYGTFATIENLVKVDRLWTVEPAEEANVLATFTDEDRSPAIIERSYGRGRTIMLTTGANLPEDRRATWSDLASPFVTSWVFVAFVEQMTEYVSRFTDISHNYLAGQIPVIPLEPENTARTILLRQPGLKQSRMSLGAFEPVLVLERTTATGHYDLYEQTRRQFLRGFSVNPPSSESDLTRLTESELDERFGEDRYEVARNINELKDDINAADIGQEIFPMLLMLVVVFFLGEHLVANRFYGGNEQLLDP